MVENIAQLRERAISGFDNAGNLSALNQAIHFYNRFPHSARKGVCEYQARIALAANFSTQLLSKALELGLFRHSVAASIYEAPFDQWEIELLDENSELHCSKPDVIILMLSTLGLMFREGRDIQDLIARLKRVVLRAKEIAAAPVIVTIPEPIMEDSNPIGWGNCWQDKVKSALTAELAGDCHLLNLEPVIRNAGSGRWYADRYWIMGKLPFHPNETPRLARYLTSYIRAVINPQVKLVITDLDETLWGGIVGEVGVEGVDLDAGGIGISYLRFQNFLLDLYNQGVLLAVCTKNNPSDAMQVFRKRPEMILTEKHFAAFEASWEPKFVMIRRILNQLALSPMGVAFLDDSPVERAEVKNFWPDITVPDLPRDPVEVVPTLIQSGLFICPTASGEDHNRQELYRTERRRQALQERIDTPAEFIASLKIVVDTEQVNAKTLDRVSQLINKTNQFNLTTRRHSRSDVVRFYKDEATYCFGTFVKDRFGHYGLTGLLIAIPAKADQTTYIIDTWLLSCRVIGRGVEHSMFKHLKRWLRDRKVNTLLGEFIPTTKNEPVKHLLSDLEFTPCDHDLYGAQGKPFKLTISPDE